MKVKVTFTVDINQDAWALEYGIDYQDVRRDVQQCLTNGMAEWVSDMHLDVDPQTHNEAMREMREVLA